MTRDDIEKDYRVKDGRCTAPGKFEGEPVYVPYFYFLWQMGFTDAVEGAGNKARFHVTPDDKAKFPELDDQPTVLLYEDDQGFVVELEDQDFQPV